MSTKINMALEYTKADYISWLSVDDRIKPLFIEKCLDSIIRDKVDLAYVRYEVHNLDSDYKIKSIDVRSDKEMEYRGYNSLYHFNYVSVFWLFKKSMWLKNRLENISCEDYDFLLKSIEDGFKIGLVKSDDTLGIYQTHKDQGSCKMNLNCIMQEVRERAKVRNMKRPDSKIL